MWNILEAVAEYYINKQLKRIPKTVLYMIKYDNWKYTILFTDTKVITTWEYSMKYVASSSTLEETVSQVINTI